MNTAFAFLFSWFWAAVAPLTAADVRATDPASPPPPSCAAAPSSAPTASKPSGPCKTGVGDKAAPRSGDPIYNGI